MGFEYEIVINEFNKYISRKFPTYLKNLPTKYMKALEYTLKAGGKRIRPVIVYLAGKMFSIDKEILFNIGMALEVLHTASLIHDDLPAIDNDDFRRGIPTCHKVFGEDIAILAGDGLIFLSFEILTKLKISPSVKEKLISEFAELSGLQGMVRGEVKDVLMTGGENTFEEVIKMYEDKTGALFGFAFEVGGICAIEYSKAEKLKKIGKDFGVAFQIFDDIKDVIGDFQKIGKTPGKDQKQNKATVVKFLGIENSMKLAQDYYDKSLIALQDFDGSEELTDFLCRIKTTLIER